MLHNADHAVGLEVSPSPSGKRLDAVTVYDGNFADTWRTQLSDVLEVLSSGDTSQPHVLFRVQNRRGEGCEDPSLELRAGGVSGNQLGAQQSIVSEYISAPRGNALDRKTITDTPRITGGVRAMEGN